MSTDSRQNYEMSKRPFVPNSLPVTDLDWRRLLPLIGKANGALARYDGMLQTLPNPAILLSPITANEAVLSSRIEGTQATLEEVLQQDAGLLSGDASKRADIQEIVNYRAVLTQAEQELLHRQMSLGVVRLAHQILMQGVRGHTKTPGSFRVDQNWIGRPGCTMNEARFVPPDPMVLGQALDNWQDYVDAEDEDPVLQVAVAHAQFEILHPFKDGNGRVGRMLIPLLLFQRRTLSRPMFYLSEFLEHHRSEYYDRLLAITEGNDWQGWVEFFAVGVVEQADRNLEKARQILNLYAGLKERFITATHSQYAVPCLDAFFQSPVINVSDFQASTGIANGSTAGRLLKHLHDDNLIVNLRPASGRRPAVFALPDLINIAEGQNGV